MMTTPALAYSLLTGDTGTQGAGKGYVEIGTSFFYDKNKVDEWTTYKTEGGESYVQLAFGLIDNLDIILYAPYGWYSLDENNTRINRADGISDIAFDVKWKCFEKDGWSLAIKPGIQLPSGNENKGLGTGRTGCRLLLIGTKELEPFAFHANLGYIRNENKTDERTNIWHASFAAEYEIRKDLKLLADIAIERNPATNSDNHPVFAYGGFSYDISERLTIDTGVGYGLTETETDWTYLTSLTITF